jgi:hypothetical protein
MQLLQRICDHANAEQRCIIAYADKEDLYAMLSLAEQHYSEGVSLRDIAAFAASYIRSKELDKLNKKEG